MAIEKNLKRQFRREILFDVILLFLALLISAWVYDNINNIVVKPTINLTSFYHKIILLLNYMSVPYALTVFCLAILYFIFKIKEYYSISFIFTVGIFWVEIIIGLEFLKSIANLTNPIFWITFVLNFFILFLLKYKNKLYNETVKPENYNIVNDACSKAVFVSVLIILSLFLAVVP